MFNSLITNVPFHPFYAAGLFLYPLKTSLWFSNIFKGYRKRSGRPEMFFTESVLRIFTKFTGKHLCQDLFFNKVAGLVKKETLAQVFSCEFCENFQNTFFTRTPLVDASVERDQWHG